MATKVRKTSAIADAIDNLTLEISKQARQPSERRKHIGSGLINFGNLSAAALIFGEAFGGFDFNTRIASLGLYFLASFYLLAFFLLRGGASSD